MQIITGRTDFMLEGKSAVAIGKFDGVHRGHTALLERVLEKKKEGYQAVVFTFFPSAASFFGRKEEKELMPQAEKRRFFESLGADVLIEFPLNQETAAMPAEQFVRKVLAERMKMGYLAAGTDLSFGKNGLGSKELLLCYEKELGYQVEIIEKLTEEGKEISSTFVREMVEKGRMEAAARLLGRNYAVFGRVEEGRRLGRRLGMPTLNVYPPEDKLLPPYGVYYSRVRLGDQVKPGITNIGQKPTVKDTAAVSVETYLYDVNEDLYGKEIVTELLHFKRPEQKFNSVEALREQMERDVAEGRIFHKIP